MLLVALNLSIPQIVLAGAAEETVYYASDFNIIPDGKTDISAKLRSALKTIQQQGEGTLLFDSGTYIINEQVEVPSNITLTGNETTFQMNADKKIMLSLQGKVKQEIPLTKDAVKSEKVIQVADASQFAIGDQLLIDGKVDYLVADNNFEFNEVVDIQGSTLVLKDELKDEYKVTDGYYAGVVEFRENITINNIKFTNTLDDNTAAIRLKNSRNINISNVEFHDIRHGVYAENSTHVTVQDSFGNNTDTFTYFLKTKKASIINNIINSSKVGIRVLRNSDYAVISDNTITGTIEHGVLFNDWNEYGLIKGNKISKTGSYGICHDRNNRYTVIENNDISETGHTALAVSSTIIDDCYIIVRNNYIHDTKRTAFTFEVVSNSEFTGNYVKNIGDESRWYHGVLFIPKTDNQSSHNLISNNTFENMYGESVKLNCSDPRYTTDNVIKNNKFINVYRGIIANELNDNITIKDNEFSNVSDIVLRLSETTKYLVENVQNGEGKSIKLLASTYNSETKNKTLSVYPKSKVFQ